METTAAILSITSFLWAAAGQAAHHGRRLLSDGPPFYRPPVGYGGFNYRSAFHDYNTPEPQLNYTVRRAGPSSDHGLTAWAIVGIILAVMAAGCLVYFAALCYPVLCRRRHVQLQEKEQQV